MRQTSTARIATRSRRLGNVRRRWRESRPWVADQITNRLWALKTGSVLKNRRIKARMFRAFRMAFYRCTFNLAG